MIWFGWLKRRKVKPMEKWESELLPCIKCGKKEAKLICFKDCWYVQCPCGGYDSWQFCGFRPRGAIESWNYENRPINRQGMKK